MRMLRWLRQLVRGLGTGRRADFEFDTELRAHLDLMVDEKVRAGLPADRARREALIELGGTTQVSETVREARPGAWLATVASDARHGVRIITRRPVPSGMAILALALGIGAATSVFSVVNAVLLRPLPYADPERLVVVLHGGTGPVSSANFLDWKAGMQSFSEMAAAEYWRTDFVGDGEAEKLYALRVTPGMFPMLGVAPELGRYFPGSDDEAVAAPEVVLSHRLWQRRFAGDPAILGRSITLDGLAHTVVGVMPAGFMFAPFWATEAELWAPLSLGARSRNRGDRSLRVFARLRTDADLAGARAELSVITARLEEQFEGSNQDVVALALTDRVVGDVRWALGLLLGAVGFVLLMTCANVAHMLLAHGAARYREFGMRLALGASRRRLVRQVLTESLMLVLAGGLSGLGLAFWGVGILRTLGPPDLPRLDTVVVDARVVAFALAASILTGLLFGIAPALRAARSALSTTVRPGEGHAEGRRGRGMLTVAQFGLAILLLAGAGLTIRSFLRVQSIDPGFDPAGVLSMTVSVTGAPAGEPGRRPAFFRAALEAVEALPGVASASAINHLPLAGDLWGMSFQIEGRPEPRPAERPSATYRVVMPGYFGTMGVRLRRGRDISYADTMSTERVVVINEYFASKHWPGEDALGRRFALGGGADPEWMTVVGIAADTLREEWLESREEEMYLPFLQSPDHLTSPASHFAYLTLVVRTDGDPEPLTASVREAIWRIEPGLPISDVQTMAAVVAAATARPRFYMVLLTTFAAAAIVLAAVGIYGVMSVFVAERRREIGIRLALGAHPGRLRRHLLGHGLLLAATGTALGLVGAVLLSGAMASVVYGIEPADPATLASVGVLLPAVGLLACYLPARGATRTGALDALRED